MQHCEECGAELPENALFCGLCGRKTTSEDETTTHENITSIEANSESSTSLEMDLNDSHGTPDSSQDEKRQMPGMPPENDTEAEEQTSLVTSEYESEEQRHDPALEEQQEHHLHYQISKQENEEQIPQQDVEQTDLTQEDESSEPEIHTNHISQEQSQLTLNPIAQRETQSPYVSVQKSKYRSGPRCLLFSLVALIILIGGLAVLMGMFHLNLPGFGDSAQAVSSSAYNEIINPTGSSLTVSICNNTSTPSSSSTQGSTFILNSSSGCSTVTASKTDSSCLIFPNPNHASHQFIVDVSNASIGSRPYHLVFSVVDYSGPTTYNNARHVTVGLSEGSTGRNFSWSYRSGSISINNDEQSGTMDVMLGEESGVNFLHINGDWACGHQMKNT